MIGNDVVDLHLAATQSNWRRKGFLEKVFTEFEQEQIALSKDKEGMVWLFWSMKEAAYKAHQRRSGLPRKLNWRDYECRVLEKAEGNLSGVVKVDGEHYFTISEITSEAIFTSAVTNKEIAVKNGFFELSSEGMKTKFLTACSAHYKVPKAALHLQKNIHGTPFLVHWESKCPWPFSFTGHGRFSAFSLALMIS